MENKTIQERKEKGLCVRCGKRDDRTKNGKCLCRNCNIRNTQTMRAKRKEWRSKHLCARCGMPAETGKKHCKWCLKYFRDIMREREKCSHKKSKEI